MTEPTYVLRETRFGNLRWNPGNVTHIARHAVTVKEVTEVCLGTPMVTEGSKGRLLLIGPTENGRIVAVVLEPEPEAVFFPVTARPASR